MSAVDPLQPPASGFAGFLDQYGALLTPAVGLLALLVAGLTLVQKRNADRKAEWWRRAQFAVELLVSGDVARVLAGNELLTKLTDEKRRRLWHFWEKRRLADDDDLDLVEDLAVNLLTLSADAATHGAGQSTANAVAGPGQTLRARPSNPLSRLAERLLLGVKRCAERALAGGVDRDR